MNKTVIDAEKCIYESPECGIVSIASASVLCASMQQLVEYDGEYEW